MTTRNTPIASPQQPQTVCFVAVFAPSRAPHLARIAREIQVAVEQDFHQLLSDTARATRFYISVAEAAGALAASARFRAALGEKISRAGASNRNNDG